MRKVPAIPKRSDAAPEIPELARHPRFQSRNAPEIAPKFSVGGAEVDLARRTVRAPDGTETELRVQSAEVLRALAARRGETVTKDELHDAVWGDIAVTDDSLVQCIGDIRRALGAAARRCPDRARQGLPAGGGGRSRARAPPGGGRRSWRWAPWRSSRSRARSSGRCATTRRARPRRRRLRRPHGRGAAVREPAGGGRWDRLARGLTEEVIADLAANPWIFVLADATTRQHAGATPQAVGKALGAHHVVTGTVQAEGDRVRVTAALADAASGTAALGQAVGRAGRRPARHPGGGVGGAGRRARRPLLRRASPAPTAPAPQRRNREPARPTSCILLGVEHKHGIHARCTSVLPRVT